MSKEEIKYEINKVLDRFPDETLSELLDFLREFSQKQPPLSIMSSLEKILLEDKELLIRLAQ